MFAAFTFAACEQAPIEEQSAIRHEVPETIRAVYRFKVE